MKKIISLMLAVCMMLGMVSAFAESASVTGVWYASKMSMGDQSYDIGMLGMALTLTLNEDGSASMDTNGDVSEGTWEANAEGVAVTFEGQTINGTLADGELSLTDNEQTIIFTREAPTKMELAAEKTDATVEDFNGTYACTYVKMGDDYMPMDMAANFGLVMPKITIKDGTLEVEELEDDTIGIGSMLKLVSSLQLEMENGKMVKTVTQEGVEGSNGIALGLLEDGMMTMSLISNGEAAFDLLFNLYVEEAAE